jgi:hypothetical protein
MSWTLFFTAIAQVVIGFVVAGVIAFLGAALIKAVSNGWRNSR